MAYHIQSSFSAGEIDPALFERTTFDKYQTGLATLRNAIVGKTGRIISRQGTMKWQETRNPTQEPRTFTADAPTDVLTTNTDHVYGSGTAVTVSSTGTLPGGLTAGTVYYVSSGNYIGSISAATIPPNKLYLHSTLASAVSMIGSEVASQVGIIDAGAGTHTITPVAVESKKSILYSPPYSEYVVEWGHRYVRIHNVLLGTQVDAGHPLTEDDLDNIQFVANGKFLYIFCKNQYYMKMVLGGLGATAATTYRFTLFDYPNDVRASLFGVPIGPTYVSGSTVGPPAGYDVEYLFTIVSRGQESNSSLPFTGSKLPVTVGHSNNFVYASPTAYAPSEIRVYRRPKDGEAFGYIGASTTYTVSGSDRRFSFIDYGQAADYTHTPPSALDIGYIPDALVDGTSITTSRAGCVYQQRLLVTDTDNEEAVHASRTGQNNNFYRDYPLTSDSALTFKCGTSGNAKVIRMIDSNGLLVFTTIGIYKNEGPLGPDNLAMTKVGNWVIDDKVPPLEIPGGILFVDKSTNTVRTLIYSNEAGGFPGEEVSIFSNHLFAGKTVKSWAFQDGDTPLIWVVMSDGSLNALTYQRENKMQAWSQHDTTDGLYESVTVAKSLDAKSVVYFVVNRNGVRTIEYSASRFVDDLKKFVGMDAAVTYNSEISSGASVTVEAQDFSDWEGLLDVSSDIPIFANTADNGAVGSTFRFFDSDGSAVDLVVTSFVDTQNVTVMPTVEFPSNEGTSVKLYKTYSTLTGLDHLNGKFVSVLCDGYVVASPNNNVENYAEIMVTGGQITLPNNKRGAFIHVGIPFTVDIETLDIDTAEQKPTLLESKLVNNVFIKVYNTRGMFVGSNFPGNDGVDGLTDPEERTEDIDLGNIGNAAQKPQTKRHSIVIRNDWKSEGKLYIRQVDPLPMEILSIIPDITVLT